MYIIIIIIILKNSCEHVIMNEIVKFILHIKMFTVNFIYIHKETE